MCNTGTDISTYRITLKCISRAMYLFIDNKMIFRIDFHVVTLLFTMLNMTFSKSSGAVRLLISIGEIVAKFGSFSLL